MPKADTDLQKQEKALTDRQERVTRLREQVADAEATRSAHEQTESNKIYEAQLDREEAQLQTRLAEEKRASSKDVVSAASVPVLDAVKDQMELAVKQREGVGVADKEVKEANAAATAEAKQNQADAESATEAAAEANADASAFRPAADPGQEK